MKRTQVALAAAFVGMLAAPAAAQPITLSSSEPYRLVVDAAGKRQKIVVRGSNFENEGHPDRDEYMHWQIRRDDGGWQRCGRLTPDCDNTGWTHDSETFAIWGRFLARPGFIELRVFRGLGEAGITDPSQAANLQSGWSNVLRIPVVSPAGPPTIRSLSKSRFIAGGSNDEFLFRIDAGGVDPSVVVIFWGESVVHPARLLDGHLVEVYVPEKYRGKPAKIGIVLRTDRGGSSTASIIEIVEPPRPIAVGKPGLSGPAAQVGALAPPPGAPLAVTKAPTPVPGTCLPGFVWRQAIPADHVCVPPARRALAAKQNADAPGHRLPNGGPSGPDTCRPGFVWRDAFANDHVCVTPAERAQAAEDNRSGPSRTVR